MPPPEPIPEPVTAAGARSRAERPETPAEEGVAPELERFAATVLDWPLVRAAFERHAPGALAVRALRGLLPRGEPEARDALARVREMATASESARAPLGGLGDPLPRIEAAVRHTRPLEADELLALVRFVRGADDCLRWLGERGAELPTCAALADGFPDLRPLGDALVEVVDERGRVRDDASPQLARLRREIATLETHCERTAQRLAGSSDLRNHLAPGEVGRVHRRGQRPVLAVRAKSRGRVPGIVHDRSQSGETVYVEPRELVEPGNRLAECRSDARREETRILADLTRTVLDERPAIELATARLAELGLAATGAAYGRACDARPARLPGERGAGRGLVLRSMRHPVLLESLEAGDLEEVVPIDLRLGAEFDLLVVTGPNTGGKTLALKSAGLAALLTRLGLPVPFAEGSTVPLYDGVVADIGDEQEVRQNLSTFSSHLERIRRGLERATARTLLLLDELGGGTDPDEGAALGDALLETLLERGVPTLVSTHLGRLKEFAFRHARAENASVEFDVASLAPRFRLLVGTPGESRALAIARRLGFPPEILERAEGRLERREGEVVELMEDVRQSRERAEEVRVAAESRLEELERDRGQLERDRGALQERRGLLEAEAQRALEDQVRAAAPLIERARRLEDQLAPGVRTELPRTLDELAASLAGAPPSDRRQSFLDGLSKGDLVYLPRFKRRCTVRRVHRDKGQVTVRMGRTDLTVSLDELTQYDSL